MKIGFKRLFAVTLLVFFSSIAVYSTPTVSYKLWVCDVQVTDENKDDILNDNGKAKYDPATCTLTFNNPSIGSPDQHINYVVMSNGINLTIEGSLSFKGNIDINEGFVILDGNLTINGSFHIPVKESGVMVNGDFFIQGGSYVTNRGIRCHEFTIAAIADSVAFSGDLIASSIDAPGHTITVPEGGIFKGGSVYESDGKTKAKYVVFKPSNINYELWLGSVQVASRNIRDILGDGKAQFDSKSNTLTLDEPVINGTHSFGQSGAMAVIYSGLSNLKIVGSYHQTDASAQYGIATGNQDLTVKGDFSICGTKAGVNCKKLTVSNGTTNLNLQGGEKAAEISDVQIEDWLTQSKPVNGTVKNGQFYEADGTTVARQVTLTGPARMEYYDLWLGSTQVTDFNKNDILGDGKAVYDSQNNTLTLDNPSIRGSQYGDKIYSNISNLTIKGVFHMTMAESARGLYAEKKNTILDGDFTFRGSEYGVFLSYGGLRVKSGNLKTIGGKAGLYCSNMHVEGNVTKIELEGGNTAAYFSYYGRIVFEGSMGFSCPQNGVLSTGGNGSIVQIYESDGKTIAKKVTIEPGYRTYDLWIGETRVTGDNHEDVFGDGKVRFDPNNNVLTLKEPIIRDLYKTPDNKTSVIYSEHMNLTVKGKYRMDNVNAENGVFIKDGVLTLDGDLYFSGNYAGAKNDDQNIVLKGNVELYGGEYGLFTMKETMLGGTCKIKSNKVGLTSYKAVSVTEGAFISIEGKTGGLECFEGNLVIDGGIKGLVVSGSIHAKGITINNADGQKAEILSPVKGHFTSLYNSIVDQNENLSKYTVFGTSYDIHLGSESVTSLNKDDILKDGGKAKYDPENNMLILNDPIISGGHIVAVSLDEIHSYNIYSSGKDLTIVGNYHMKEQKNGVGIGLRGGTLTLDGDFNLLSSVYCIDVDGDIVLKGRTVAVTPGVALRSRDGKLIINDNIERVYLESGFDNKVLLVKDFVVGGNVKVVFPRLWDFDKDGGTLYDASNLEQPYKAEFVGIGYKDDGDGTVNNPYKIRNAANWNSLADNIKNGESTIDRYFRLENDIPVSMVLGDADHPFRGTFDGQGHSLTLNMSGTDGVAPFGYINGATIKNLKTTGSIQNSGSYGSGLVSRVSGDTNLIKNCVVAAGIGMGGPSGGGIVGKVTGNATLILDGCVFGGSIYNNGTMFGALQATIMVGEAESGTTIYVSNCLDISSDKRSFGRGSKEPVISNTFYTMAEKISASGFWSGNGLRAGVLSSQPSEVGTLVEDYGFVAVYTGGLKYDGLYYIEYSPTASVDEVVRTEVFQDRWFDMTGRELDGQPTRSGIYIHNGKKVMIIE